jgi:hypothetical protein
MSKIVSSTMIEKSRYFKNPPNWLMRFFYFIRRRISRVVQGLQPFCVRSICRKLFSWEKQTIWTNHCFLHTQCSWQTVKRTDGQYNRWTFHFMKLSLKTETLWMRFSLVWKSKSRVITLYGSNVSRDGFHGRFLFWLVVEKFFWQKNSFFGVKNDLNYYQHLFYRKSGWLFWYSNAADRETQHVTCSQ